VKVLKRTDEQQPKAQQWDDPTNSAIALKDDSLPGQGPITQAQQTKR